MSSKVVYNPLMTVLLAKIASANFAQRIQPFVFSVMAIID